MVRIRRFELPRYCYHTDLNRARLPIPPYPHTVALILSATWTIITIIRHYFKGFFIKVRARHKPGSVSDNHLSRPAVSDRFKRPTSRAMTGSHLAEAKSPFWSCSGWGLPEEHVTMLLCELLPHNFNLTTAEPFGGMLSVALSL